MHMHKYVNIVKLLYFLIRPTATCCQFFSKKNSFSYFSYFKIQAIISQTHDTQYKNVAISNRTTKTSNISEYNVKIF